MASIEQELRQHLDRLTAEQQRRVLEFARSLADTVSSGTSGRVLKQFAGTIDQSDLTEISRAVEQDCEQVFADEW